MRDGYRVQAISPVNPETEHVDVVIPLDLARRWYKESSVDFDNLEIAKEVLENPLRIFEGVRDYEEGGFCYVGKPKSVYVRPKCTAPLPHDCVFTVYVNRNMRLYEIRTEAADKDEDPLSPKGWKERYGGLRWRSTS